jgi:hypothetical protein
MYGFLSTFGAQLPKLDAACAGLSLLANVVLLQG